MNKNARLCRFALQRTIITVFRGFTIPVLALVRHVVHGTSEDKRAELLAKINEADTE